MRIRRDQKKKSRSEWLEQYVKELELAWEMRIRTGTTRTARGRHRGTEVRGTIFSSNTTKLTSQ